MSLNRHARRAVEELAAAGVTPSPDEAVELHLLGEAVDRAGGGAGDCRASAPVRAGGEVLWPMTLAGAEWWDAARRLGLSRGERVVALAWCLAHGRDPEALAVEDRRGTVRRIRAWSRRLGVTLVELECAVNAVGDIAELDRAEAADAAAGAYAAWLEDCGMDAEAAAVREIRARAKALAAAPGGDPQGVSAGYWRTLAARAAGWIGGTPDEWMTQPFAGVVQALVANAEARALSGGTGGGPDHAVASAVRALRAEVARILKARRGKGAGDG